MLFYEKIDKKKLHEAIRDYNEELKYNKDAEIPYYIYKSFYILANKYSFKQNFINYSFKNDMISEAIINCLKYITTYDYNKFDNPVSYFMQAIHNIFVQVIKKEKHQSAIKDLHMKMKMDEIYGYGRKVINSNKNNKDMWKES